MTILASADDAASCINHSPLILLLVRTDQKVVIEAKGEGRITRMNGVEK
jgi:hypothetical protein